MRTPRSTRQVMVGDVAVGGDAPVSVQSMTTTKTADVDGTLAQIYALAAAGCRHRALHVQRGRGGRGPRADRAALAGADRRRHPLPVQARARRDGSGRAGAAPEPRQHPQARAHQARRAPKRKDRGLPIRIGVNAGSLDPAMAEQHGGITPEALVASAMHELDLFREVDFDDVKISVKASNVPLMIDAYRLLVGDHRPSRCTSASPKPDRCRRGSSSRVAGIGTLLAEGIGDTIRFSLTADPGRRSARRAARCSKRSGCASARASTSSRARRAGAPRST